MIKQINDGSVILHPLMTSLIPLIELDLPIDKALIGYFRLCLIICLFHYFGGLIEDIMSLVYIEQERRSSTYLAQYHFV